VTATARTASPMPWAGGRPAGVLDHLLDGVGSLRPDHAANLTNQLTAGGLLTEGDRRDGEERGRPRQAKDSTKHGVTPESSATRVVFGP